MSKKIRAGIDVRTVDVQRRGIGLYVEKLVENFGKNRECEIVLFGNQESEKILRELAPGAKHIEIPFKLGDRRWEESEAGKLCDEMGLDVYHGPSFTCAISGKAARVVTVHDLCFWKHPEFYDLKFVRNMERAFRESMLASDVVLANSQETKKDVSEFMGVEEIPVLVTPLGVEELFYQKPDWLDREELKKKYSLKEQVILGVGMGQPRKNLERILGGFAMLDKKVREKTSLVIVGEGWQVNPRAEQEARTLGIVEDIVITGEISRSKLWILYHIANLLCYPSLHEGFGLPILEAMACGTPVVTSDCGAMREIALDAACLVNPESRESIGKAMKEILQDINFAESLKEKGKKRARSFTWEKTAAQTLQGYEEAIRAKEKRREKCHAVAKNKDKKKINIGIDARFYGKIQTGTGRYTTEIVDALLKNKEQSFTLLGIAENQKIENARLVPERGMRLLDEEWEQSELRKKIQEHKIDAYFSPTGICPAEVEVPTIVVVHDLGFEHYPQFYSERLLCHLKKWLKESCGKARKIIAVSEYTRRDIMRTWGVSYDKIQVVYPGVEHIFSGREREESDSPYILALSSGGPNKNIEGIKKSFACFMERYANLPHRLVLAGNVQEETRENQRKIEIAGIIEDRKLLSLMQGASCLVHLSYFEGFGLPVAEAMSLGVPVIASQRASLPEVVGDAGILVDPDSPEECAQAIARIIQNQALARLLSQKGLYRSQSFRWKEAARQILECLEENIDTQEATAIEIAQKQPGKKIALVSTWGLECGIAIYTKDLAYALEEAGIEVVVLAEKAPGINDATQGIPVYRCWLRGNSLTELWEEVEKQSPDLVHIQHHGAFFPDDLLASFLWKLKNKGIPGIVTFHEIVPTVPQPVFLAPDRILVHTEQGKKALLQMGVGGEIEVIAHGMRSLPFAPKTNTEGKVILSYGFLQPSKGFHFVIDALALLKEEFPDLCYRIAGARRAGAEEYPEILRQRAREKGLEARVEIIEKFLSEEELSQEIANADVVVFPYPHHVIGSSGAITQALSMGASVIVSPMPYFEDLGDTVLRAGSTEEIASAIKNILTNPSLAEMLKKCAKSLAEERKWTNLAQGYKKLYERAIHNNRKNLEKKIHPWVSVHIISKETDRLGLHFFKSCLESLRGYPDKLVVVDNGSNQEVLDMLQEEMKVLMLTMEYPEDTQTEYIESLAQALGKEDVHVRVVCLRFGEKRKNSHKGVHIHKVDPMDFPSFHWVSDAVLNNMKTLEESIIIAEKEPWDLIVAYDWLCALTAKSLKTIYGIPLIANIYDLEVAKKGNSLAREEYYIAEMQGWICQHAERIITTSLFMQGKISSIYNIPCEKIQIIPRGINPEQWVTHCNLEDFRHLFVPARSKIVLFSGQLVPSQGPQILLEAAKQVLQAMPETTFLFTGNGELYQDLSQKARQIKGNILFPGQLKGKALTATYKIADCLAIPSLYEPYSAIALETMTCGTPIIASDTGILSEIIDDRMTGLKISPDNPQALAQAILGLLSDPPMAQNLAKRAMEQVQKKYLISDIAIQTKNIYQDTLKYK